MSDSENSESCSWCGKQSELVDDEYAVGCLVTGPAGNVLNLAYGLFCRECWNHIRQMWRESGDLSRPLSAYGRVPA